MAEPADTYRRLLDVAKSVGHTRLRTSRRHAGQRRTELQQLLDDVTDKLRSERAVSAIEEAWRNLDGDVASLLLRQLSLITCTKDGTPKMRRTMCPRAKRASRIFWHCRIR